MSNKLTSLVLGGALGLLAVPSCDLNIPDLNNPGLDQLETNPTPSTLNAAATGLLVGNRGGKSNATGLVNQLGILGRESYDFDPNDGRFVTELIAGTLQKASPFGGVFWAGNFTNLRTANVVLHAADKITAISDPANAASEKSAMKGFAHTIQALEFLTLYITHFDTGAPVDVDRDLSAPLAPFVSKAEVLKKVTDLLDQGQTELAAGGDAFTFPLSPGYAGFDTPATFLTFNRAMRAQAAVYGQDYAGALNALKDSFLIDDTTDMNFSFNTGVFYSFSTNAGDTANGLFARKSVFAHDSFKTDVEKKPDGTPADARYLAKIKDLAKPVTNTNDSSLTTTITFNIYNSASTPIPVINNEELILLKAEALWFNGDHAGAVTELNIVRTGSGKLAALDPATITDDIGFVHALLYERRYSLMYNGGHRWIDLRRFAIKFPSNPEFQLPLDDATKHKRNVRFPVPQAECDARPGEVECNIKSTDPLPAS